jgi:hypothetical protein
MHRILLALPVCVAFGQNPAPPAFEAAPVKAAAPLDGDAMMFGSGSMSGRRPAARETPDSRWRRRYKLAAKRNPADGPDRELSNRRLVCRLKQ